MAVVCYSGSYSMRAAVWVGISSAVGSTSSTDDDEIKAVEWVKKC